MKRRRLNRGRKDDIESLAATDGQGPGLDFEPRLGDFTATPRILFISFLALVIGVIGAILALVLLRLIGLFTNLFFFQQLSLSSTRPSDASLDWGIFFVPVLGSTIVGLMARYGSDRIRGHGIPEALEAILINRSRLDAKVAVLKPLSAAISIGAGGPFGAEGPIIMTGGSFGSLMAQVLHLTSAERKTLLVAGAAAGMSATFASPVAAVMLSVELLLFEWKPRSLVPVAVASLTAVTLRYPLLGPAPLFPVPPHDAHLDIETMLLACGVGLTGGMLSAALTTMVYAAEDAFLKLPIHWMWWPTLGGVAIGIGALVFPRALGVGYGTISELLNGQLPLRIIIGVLIVKALIWSISLGSGTSGGVLAPLLMMGAALGGLEASVLPNEGVGFWALVAMAATLGGTMRSPLTAVIFALELTHDLNMMAPLLSGVIVAHAFTVLTLRRSILTEKVSRRGYHLTREYAIDPLETRFVREVMRRDFVSLPQALTASEVLIAVGARKQDLYPVTSDDGRVISVYSRDDLVTLAESNARDGANGKSLHFEPSRVIGAHPDEQLRVIAHRMAETGFTRLPVLEPGGSGRVIGIVTLKDLLQARAQDLEAETKRERHIDLRQLGLQLRSSYLVWLPKRTNGRQLESVASGDGDSSS